MIETIVVLILLALWVKFSEWIYEAAGKLWIAWRWAAYDHPVRRWWRSDV